MNDAKKTNDEIENVEQKDEKRANARLRPLPPEYVAMNIVSCASTSSAPGRFD